MTELAIPRSDAEVAQLTRDGFMELVERGAYCLTQAAEYDPIDAATALGALKADAATLETYARQRDLGRSAELAAAELVRRAERGIGVAIRKGQAEGSMRVAGQSGGPRRDYERAGRTVHVDQRQDPMLISPQFSSGEDRTMTYAVTDNITDEQFDAAIRAARAEGNLSRANVVRKVRGDRQDGDRLAMPQPPRYGGNRRKHAQALDALTVALDGLTTGTDEIHELDPSVTPDHAAELADQLNRHIRSLNRVRNLLKERAQ